MGPADSTGIPRVPAYSGAALSFSQLRIRDCHPLRSYFPVSSARSVILVMAVLQPLIGDDTSQVWATARSLATTYAITFVFFSSGY